MRWSRTISACFSFQGALSKLLVHGASSTTFTKQRQPRRASSPPAAIFSTQASLPEHTTAHPITGASRCQRTPWCPVPGADAALPAPWGCGEEGTLWRPCAWLLCLQSAPRQEPPPPRGGPTPVQWKLGEQPSSAHTPGHLGNLWLDRWKRQALFLLFLHFPLPRLCPLPRLAPRWHQGAGEASSSPSSSLTSLSPNCARLYLFTW